MDLPEPIKLPETKIWGFTVRERWRNHRSGEIPGVDIISEVCLVGVPLFQTQRMVSDYELVSLEQTDLSVNYAAEQAMREFAKHLQRSLQTAMEVPVDDQAD